MKLNTFGEYDKAFEVAGFKSYKKIDVRDSELESHIINFIELNPNSDLFDIASDVRTKFNETDIILKKILSNLVTQKLIVKKSDKYAIR